MHVRCNLNGFIRLILCALLSTGDSGKVTTVVATPGQGPDRPQEVSYTDIKVIGNGSFGVVYQARLIDSQEMVAIKKVLQDKRFKVRLTDSAWSDNYSVDKKLQIGTFKSTKEPRVGLFFSSRRC